MANLLIIALALLVALGGVAAIAEGVINERSSRRSPHSWSKDEVGDLADEIREWLKDQR